MANLVPAIIFSFLKISIAQNIKKYNDELYLDLGYRISNWHLLSSFVSLRYIFFLYLSNMITMFSIMSNGIAFLCYMDNNYQETCWVQILNIINRVFGVMSVICYSLQWLIIGMKKFKVCFIQSFLITTHF